MTKIYQIKDKYDVYIAIGDIHGMYNQFVALKDKVIEVFNELVSEGRKPVVIFLGDLIDRGPKSREVVELVRNFPVANIVVGGNHEDFMVDYNGGKSVWLHPDNGGNSTINSYIEGDKVEEFWNDRSWMDTLPDMVLTETYAFVHAGIDAGYRITEQRPQDCRWIREKFLEYKHPFERYIVHGHSPEYRVANFLTNRCNLDTGSYYTGIITAGVFFEENIASSFFISAKGGNTRSPDEEVTVTKYTQKMDELVSFSYF